MEDGKNTKNKTKRYSARPTSQDHRTPTQFAHIYYSQDKVAVLRISFLLSTSTTWNASVVPPTFFRTKLSARGLYVFQRNCFSVCYDSRSLRHFTSPYNKNGIHSLIESLLQVVDVTPTQVLGNENDSQPRHLENHNVHGELGVVPFSGGQKP